MVKKHFKTVTDWILVALLPLFTVQGCTSLPASVSYFDNGRKGEAFLCRPEGKGPFAAVVYSYGVIIDQFGLAGAFQRGYDLNGICYAIAKEGFLAVIPLREDLSLRFGRTSRESYQRHKEGLWRAIDFVKTIPDVDSSRLALMGHSRGGLLTLMLAVERKDLRAFVVSAPAPGPAGTFSDVLTKVKLLNAPILLLAEKGEEDPRILENLQAFERTLQTQQKEGQLIVYTRGGGHRLFFTVDYYWDDVRTFLREKLGSAHPS